MYSGNIFKNAKKKEDHISTPDLKMAR